MSAYTPWVTRTRFQEAGFAGKNPPRFENNCAPSTPARSPFAILGRVPAGDRSRPCPGLRRRQGERASLKRCQQAPKDHRELLGIRPTIRQNTIVARREPESSGAGLSREQSPI